MAIPGMEIPALTRVSKCATGYRVAVGRIQSGCPAGLSQIAPQLAATYGDMQGSTLLNNNLRNPGSIPACATLYYCHGLPPLLKTNRCQAPQPCFYPSFNFGLHK
uniref:Putative secreted protein n=1 Tax=Ixodes ricinus TaxID=34613 RepID=A0A0K8RLQ2_IXORI